MALGEDGEGEEEIAAKSPLKGFRPKPEWVPSLEIRLAMVRSPRKQKAAGAKVPTQRWPNAAPNNAMAKQVADQNKKLVQQMGGVNGFAPKAGGAKPKAGAKAAAGGVAKPKGTNVK